RADQPGRRAARRLTSRDGEGDRRRAPAALRRDVLHLADGVGDARLRARPSRPRPPERDQGGPQEDVPPPGGVRPLPALRNGWHVGRSRSARRLLPGADSVVDVYATSRRAQMAKYADGFVLPVPKDKVEDYRQIAQQAGEVWREHGALEYYECVAEDVNVGELTSFPRSVQAEDGETVV